jgi:hypothetical protein
MDSSCFSILNNFLKVELCTMFFIQFNLNFLFLNRVSNKFILVLVVQRLKIDRFVYFVRERDVLHMAGTGKHENKVIVFLVLVL